MSVESVATMLMIVPEANEVVDQGQEGLIHAATPEVALDPGAEAVVVTEIGAETAPGQSANRPQLLAPAKLAPVQPQPTPTELTLLLWYRKAVKGHSYRLRIYFPC